MTTLHLCNANFEWELTQKRNVPIEEVLQKPPGLQLQFLPYLYARQTEGMVTTNRTLPSFTSIVQHGPHMHLLSDVDFSAYSHVESWGASKNIARWAEQKGLQYPHPTWEATLQANSKAYSFANSPSLPGSTLLFNENEVSNWIRHQTGPIVFKTCFGLAGKGHLIQLTPQLDLALIFMRKEWEKNLPVIAEPWVERLLDFSTQWIISENKEIHYVGACLIINSPQGKYLGTRVGDETQLFDIHLPFLEMQRTIAFDVLKKIADLGYFGNVGIDAMLYYQDGQVLLHPIVEINARKTMGWATLALQRQHFPLETLLLSFSPKCGFTINTN
jgi:hypothetical protein